MHNTISQRFRTAFSIMRNKSTLLWGLTLLTMFMCIAISALGSAVPIITIPVCLALQAGLSAVYLKAIRGEKYETADIFAAFKDFNTAKHVIGGMLWMNLWILIWALIPIAGIVFAVIKSLEYAFTPYILMTRPEVGAMEALKESKRLTKGLKGRMFGAIIIPIAIYIGAAIILGVFSLIPIIGILFGLALFCLYVAVILFLPMLMELLTAGFYDGAVNPPPPPQYNGQYPPQYQPYPQYGQQNQQPYPPQQQYYQPNPQQGQYYQPYTQQVQPQAPVTEPAPFAPTAPVDPVNNGQSPEPVSAEADDNKTVQIDPPPQIPETPNE